MDIKSVITEEEYNSVDKLNYSRFCDFIRRLVKLCVEESLKSLPAVITHLSAQAAYLKGLSDSFYKENKDLGLHRNIVTAVIQSVESDNPGKSYEEILQLAAPLARERIRLLKNSTDSERGELIDYDWKLKKL